MNHRQRVLTALRHQEPDRVPIDLGGTVDSTMAGMDTKELKREFGGGFVLSPVHNVQTGVPPENVVAMFETAHEYGVYHI